MKKFEGILICTDLDGTLLRDDKSISKRNIEAIEYFKAEGGFFSLVTGRAPQIAAVVCEKVCPNAPIGCMNGGGIYDWNAGKYVWAQTVPDDIRDIVRTVMREVPSVALHVNTFGPLYFQRDNSAMTRFRKLTGLPDLQKDCDDITEPITKVFFADDDEAAIEKVMEVLANHPKRDLFSYIRSEIDKYEVLPKGISKGTALLKIAETVGATKTIAVGDYNNDIPMFEAAQIGIAVANACEDALAAADIVTVSNEEDAMAKIIEDIEEGIIK